MATGGGRIERGCDFGQRRVRRVLKDIEVRMNAVDRNRRHSAFSTLLTSLISLRDMEVEEVRSHRSEWPPARAGLNGRRLRP